MRRPAPSTVRWAILIALLVFWEAMPGTRLIPELFLPSLSKTLTVLWIDQAEYAQALVVTLYEVAFAMLIACGAGILTGALVGGPRRRCATCCCRSSPASTPCRS